MGGKEGEGKARGQGKGEGEKEGEGRGKGKGRGRTPLLFGRNRTLNVRQVLKVMKLVQCTKIYKNV